MGDVVDDIQPGYALGLEEIHRLAFLFRENRHQHISTGDFALAGGLDMEHRPLQHALETQGWLRIPVVFIFGDQGCGGVDKLDQIAAQCSDVCRTGLEYADGVVVIQQCEQEMLDRHKLVSLGPGSAKGVIQGLLQVFT